MTVQLQNVRQVFKLCGLIHGEITVAGWVREEVSYFCVLVLFYFRKSEVSILNASHYVFSGLVLVWKMLNLCGHYCVVIRFLGVTV